MRDRVIQLHAEKLKRKSATNFKIMKWLMLIIIILGIILYVILELARIKDIVVTGNEHYTVEQVIKMVGIKEQSNAIEVYFDKNSDYSMYSYIQKIDINYNSYNQIHITVKEKEVISYIKYQNQYLVFDKDGYIIDYIDDKKEDVPVVKGLYIKSAVVGEKLDIEESIIITLLDLYHLRNKYGILLTSIEFPLGNDSAVNVYVDQIKIIFGETIDLDRKMRNTSEVIKAMSDDLSGTLDLSEDKEQFILKKSTK